MSTVDSNKKVFNVIVLGSVNVGKTCLLNRLCEREFPLKTMPIDVLSRITFMEDKFIEIAFWDIAFHLHFRSTSQPYEKVHGVIFVYDVTNIKSFKELFLWIDEYRKFNSSNIPQIIIGNKCDLYKDKIVETERVRSFFKTCGVPFFETSAKTDNLSDPIEYVFQIFSLLMSTHEYEIEKEPLPSMMNWLSNLFERAAEGLNSWWIRNR
ncbi:hypothetical protein JTE90_025767 [Oedothorax gibbosus]|uniref:GTP-binding protein n=1 Tax=Oedothorax gibbosus TaxID=931172 RepID=A0AAV6U5M7_9ARAC|nr:hypothetical protein JTE90_025767 [Oedothorax gibbosus]